MSKEGTKCAGSNPADVIQLLRERDQKQNGNHAVRRGSTKDVPEKRLHGKLKAGQKVECSRQKHRVSQQGFRVGKTDKPDDGMAEIRNR